MEAERSETTVMVQEKGGVVSPSQGLGQEAVKEGYILKVEPTGLAVH